MSKMNGQEYAEKLVSRLTQAGQEMARGVDRVTVAPGRKAAEKKDKFRARLLASIDDGTWERNVGAVTLDDWKSAMKGKGIPRVAAGAQAAIPKIAAFGDKLMSYQDSIRPGLDNLPDTTLQDSVNRVTYWITKMAQFRK